MRTTSVQGPRRLARRAFVFVAAAFALGVIIQIFTAGLAIFVNPLNWTSHVTFVRVLEFLPLLMLLLAFVGRLPTAVRWQSAGLLGLIFVQYFTANITAVSPWIAATHPITAMVLFWLSLRVTTQAWQLNSNPA